MRAHYRLHAAYVAAIDAAGSDGAAERHRIVRAIHWRLPPGAGLSPGGGLAKCRSRVPLVVPLMPAATEIVYAACP